MLATRIVLTFTPGFNVSGLIVLAADVAPLASSTFRMTITSGNSCGTTANRDQKFPALTGLKREDDAVGGVVVGGSLRCSHDSNEYRISTSL